MAFKIFPCCGLLKNVPNSILAHLLNDLAADLIHLLALLKVDDF